MTDSKRDNLLNEAQSLHFTQYIDEVVKSLTTGKLSIKDHDIMIEICQIMHHRYEEFAKLLI
jgi:regulator of nonsense transcripts 2